MLNPRLLKRMRSETAPYSEDNGKVPVKVMRHRRACDGKLSRRKLSIVQ